jgi:hypothetical protein
MECIESKQIDETNESLFALLIFVFYLYMCMGGGLALVGAVFFGGDDTVHLELQWAFCSINVIEFHCSFL